MTQYEALDLRLQGIELPITIATLDDLNTAGAYEVSLRDADGVTVHILLQQLEDGQITAFENRCPHAGTRLNETALDRGDKDENFLDSHGQYLLCRTHGALFKPSDGRCVRGPCKGQSLRRIRIAIREDVISLV